MRRYVCSDSACEEAWSDATQAITTLTLVRQGQGSLHGSWLTLQGYPHLTKLIGSTQFPWLLSNIVDTTTGKQPEALRRFWVTERCGARIGIIGLVEE